MYYVLNVKEFYLINLATLIWNNFISVNCLLLCFQNVKKVRHIVTRKGCKQNKIRNTPAAEIVSFQNLIYMNLCFFHQF